jgi:patatin-like phospholipase/acyl hydrolase
VEFERLSAKRVVDLFDLFIGTSAGGILALAVVCTPSPARPAVRRMSSSIFTSSDGERFFRGAAVQHLSSASLDPAAFGGLISDPMGILKQSSQCVGAIAGGNVKYAGNARYFPDALEAALRQSLGDVRLGDAVKPTIVTSY